MIFRPGLRGDINALLNPLVASGEIKSYSTNLYEKPAPDQVIVTVVAGSEKEADAVRLQVAQVLASLGEHILVKVDLRKELGRQKRDGEP